jgi:hypothetical protein
MAEQPQPSRKSVQSLANASPLPLHSIRNTIENRNSSRKRFFPIPWQLVMVALRAAEILNITLPFRSDSLVGLIHSNPKPEISAPPASVTFHHFA